MNAFDPVVAYCSVMWAAAGTGSSRTRRYGPALFPGVPGGMGTAGGGGGVRGLRRQPPPNRLARDRPVRAARWRSSSSGLRKAATWSYWRCATPPMVSTMTFDQLVDTYADHAGVDEDRARERLTGHLDNAGDPPELATRVKIVLVSSDSAGYPDRGPGAVRPRRPFDEGREAVGPGQLAASSADRRCGPADRVH